MIKKRIGICGYFGGNRQVYDGQTVKTKEITQEIENHYNKKIDKFDTYKNSHNPFKLFFGVNKLLKNNDIFILIVSQRGYTFILPLINFLNFFYKRTLYDFVIGGTRYNLYDKNKILRKIALKYKKIYVETLQMQKEYNERGLFNVEVFPNFKRINIFDKISNFENKNVLKLCTFSRIRKEKGIEDAIEAVSLANKKMKKEVFTLDIYGNPDDDYKDKFAEILNEMPNFVNYKGLVPSNESSSTLQGYDLMLFLTYWPSEGFPGTIIDAFSSGLPVIATDWNCNFEILKENITGIKVKVKDIEGVANILIDCYKNQKNIYNMRFNCIKEAKKYLPNNIMRKFYNEIEKLG